MNSKEQKRMMLHALGEPLQRPPEGGKCYRNYYYDLKRNKEWEELCTLGLAIAREVPVEVGGGIYYHLTKKGIIVATDGKYSEESR